MDFIFSALATAYTGVVVWLGVRYLNRREWWTQSVLAGFVAFPVLYVLSFIVLWPHIEDGSSWTGSAVDYLKLCALIAYSPLLIARDASPVIRWLVDLVKLY
jgi:hypothetical protein